MESKSPGSPEEVAQELAETISRIDSIKEVLASPSRALLDAEDMRMMNEVLSMLEARSRILLEQLEAKR